MKINDKKLWNRLLSFWAILLIACPAVAGNVSYTYDALNRLTGATYSDDTVIEYRYDAAGNRISQIVQAATADFFTLTVSQAGTGSGTITGIGINCGSDCTESYSGGTSVTLTATAASGFTFTGWSGACSGTGTCIVTMDDVQSATATFFDIAPPTYYYTLTVSTAGTGSGTITGTGINCGSDCTENYTSGTSVTLTATAASGSTFTGWSGACSGTGTCAVAIDATKSVTAIFDILPPTRYPLTVSTTGTGSGTIIGTNIDCGSDCTESYSSGTSITLTATAASGSNFTGWSGACSGTGSCTVAMDTTKSVTATFDIAPPTRYTLTVSTAGTGSGTIIGTNIDCGSDCTESYSSGTSITLTATAASGSTFTGWSGACSGTGTCIVTMDDVQGVTATFTITTVFQTVAETISWFYAAAFNRTPIPNSALSDNGDIGGLVFWTQTYLTGEGDLAIYRDNVHAIADFFVASKEFQARYPASLTSEQFVTALYQNMLGREPDTDGFTYWVGRLNHASRGRVLADFTNTDENRNANPLRKTAMKSYIAFLDADQDKVITVEEAAAWLAEHPDLNGAVVDGN